MPLIAPVLDDRNFEQLFRELRDRIPVYNPQWTDWNESDPAITLLQLFAFLGEGLQFRFNQIPEATQLAFLKLLDLPLRPAGPAKALVRCTTTQAGGVAMYAGDQLKAGKTIFTVRTDARLWPLDCVTIARQRTAKPILANEEEVYSAFQASVDALAAARPKLDDVAAYRIVALASDASTPPLAFDDTVDGCMWIAVLAEQAGSRPQPGEQRLQLSIGFSPEPYVPGSNELKACPGERMDNGPALQIQVSTREIVDGVPRYLTIQPRANTTAGFTQEGMVQIEMPTDLAQLGIPEPPVGLAGTGDFPPELDGKQAERVWFWLRVWRADKSRIGKVRLVCLNAVECVQSVAAAPELLGGGSGQPNQVFRLANRPVLLDRQHPFRLRVEENGHWADWTPKDDLDASDEGDRHFVVDAEAGTVRFGRRYPQIGERVSVVEYHHGGGAAGNVPAHAISKADAPKPGVVPPAPLQRLDAAKFDNPFKADGGYDGETVEAALERIPGDLRRRTRAVTRDDFSELAMMTPGVDLGRAECLPLFHAPDRISPRAGTVSVVVWPSSDPRRPNAPLPDSYQLKRVCEWLDTKRLVTTELFVIPPTYRRIAISVAVKVKDGFGLDAVRDWVELLLRQYLAPLPPHGPEGEGWPLGRRVLDRELEGVAMQVQGVEYVAELRLAGSNGGSPEQWQQASTVQMQAWEVPEVAAITIVSEGTDLPPPGKDVAPAAGDPPVPVPVLRPEC